MFLSVLFIYLFSSQFALFGDSTFGDFSNNDNGYQVIVLFKSSVSKYL